MIKYLITGGCSFSCYTDDNNWNTHLAKNLKKTYPNLIVNHTGYKSQGQELIQKKVTLAVVEALKNGYSPNEILVAVMWSGNFRKAWYIDNPVIIEKITSFWSKFKGGMCDQFLDLKNNYSKNTGHFTSGYGDSFSYNPNGGWYYTVNGSDTNLEFVTQYYQLDDYIGKIHSSLENIIFLQNFCKLNNIKLINQFFMDNVYQDFLNNKENQMINYLFTQLDEKMIIEGMFEYLHSYIGVKKQKVEFITHEERKKLDNGRDIFSRDGFHPGDVGAKLWCNNVLLPFIKKNYDII